KGDFGIICAGLAQYGGVTGRGKQLQIVSLVAPVSPFPHLRPDDLQFLRIDEVAWFVRLRHEDGRMTIEQFSQVIGARFHCANHKETWTLASLPHIDSILVDSRD